MLEMDTEVERRSVHATDDTVPPPPRWLPVREATVPPRPQWLPHRSLIAISQSVSTTEPSIDTGDEPLERHRNWRQDTTAFLVSLSLHVMVLLVIWQLFRVVMQPSPSTFVITTEIDTGEGAESELLTMIDSPTPKVQPVANLTAAVDVTNVAIADTQPGGDLPRAGGGAGDGIGFFGAKASANSVVFVVDKSGSMSDDGRIRAAKRELSNALLQLQPHQQFYVIFYSNSTSRMLAPDSPEQLLPATRSNVAQVLKWITTDVEAGGGTEPRDSLLTALEMEPEVIFFLTDGDVEPSTAATVHLNNSNGTIIHTLCLSEEYGETVMRRIARENMGRYRFVETHDLTSQTSVSHEASDAKQAAAKLKIALRHLNQGRIRTGQRWLEKLIKDHPNTPQARQAEQRLNALDLAP